MLNNEIYMMTPIIYKTVFTNFLNSTYRHNDTNGILPYAYMHA